MSLKDRKCENCGHCGVWHFVAFTTTPSVCLCGCKKFVDPFDNLARTIYELWFKPKKKEELK